MKKSIQYLLGCAAVVIIIAGLKIGADLVNQILLSLVFAISIAPLPEWLTRKGMSKGLSLLISLLLIFISGFLLYGLFVKTLADLVDSFPIYKDKLTDIYNKLSAFAENNNLNISVLINKVNISPDKVIGFAGSVAAAVSKIISSSLIIIMLVVFIIIELVGYTVDTSKGKRDQISLHVWLTGIGSDLRKYITITALKGVIKGIMNLVVMLILGVDFAFLWAFLAFFMNFIPTLGIIFTLIPPVLIALIMLGPFQALIVLIAIYLINFVVENVIGPIFMKQSLNVSLLNSFLSLIVWGWILGLTGAILGIPLTMVVMKIFDDTGNKEKTGKE
jgi:AI-2 transport protein TqsA